jgi:hypothetical protein
VITYVRQQNRRGDARHPSHTLAETLVDEGCSVREGDRVTQNSR